MDGNWASENLQVIRTLMERSALYRRALAPIMLTAGLIGLAGATIACFVSFTAARQFSLYWMCISLAGLVTAFLLVRRQALREREPVWSPPTRRVMSALSPPFFAGLVGGCGWALGQDVGPLHLLVSLWLVCYGCGLHASGFFMARGIRLLGWVFILAGTAYFTAGSIQPDWRSAVAGHYVMGVCFGLLQLAYGVYLLFTEKSRRTL